MTTEAPAYNLDDPSTTLLISQKAPSVLAQSSLLAKSLPLSALSAAESPEAWSELEQVFYATLRAGDDESAHLCLERLSKRFGAQNQRVMAMRGLYQEAKAKDWEELRGVLQDYNKILEANPMNIPVHKRRIALIKSVGRHEEAIKALVDVLESFPTDTEGWCELSDLYQAQGMSAQAIFCLEEALLLVPNAWNLHARLGELNYIASQSGQDGQQAARKYLSDSVRRFARSVELCKDYLRGYYGLKLATDKLLQLPSGKEEPEIATETVKELGSLAGSKLKSIVEQYSSQASGARQSELIAAQALLDRSKS